MTGSPAAPSAVVRMVGSAEVLVWVAQLTAVWVVLTLAGGVVLGMAPATVAAVHLVRARDRGDVVRPLRDGLGHWRRELRGAQPAVLPALLLLVVLWSHYALLSATGPQLGALRLATLAGVALVAVATAYLPSLYVHYSLPWYRYPVVAVRLTLGRPASSVLLLLVTVTAGAAVAAAPGLALVAVGGWLQTTAWLCLRFLADNERRLAAADPTTRRPDLAQALPCEPLRIS